MTLEPDGRILFVDDEPRVLEGLENLLFDAPDGWEIEFARSGAEALALLRDAPFDVLVTDLAMPGIDGSQLLAEARLDFPGVVRIILSGHTEEAVANRALPIAHEFLSKPCNADTLFAAVDRALKLRDRTMDGAIRDVVGRLTQLPGRPVTYQRLQALISGDAGINEVANTIESEITLAARVLHVANAGFYSRGRPVSAIRDAVSRLGSKTTAAIALASETLGTVKVPRWFDLDELHRHSLRVGNIARRLVANENRDVAFLGGMMHDIGALVIAANYPEQWQAIAASTERHVPDEATERNVLGFSHARLGGYFLRLWNVSESAASSVESHHVLDAPQRHEIDLAIFAADYALHHAQPSDLDEKLGATESNWVSQARTISEEQV